MLSDVRFFWFCLAVIAAYSCLWWATSLEPRSRRSKIQAGLRPLYERLTGFQHTFETAATYDDVEGQMVDFNRTLNEAGQWIAANMSSAAFQKFKNPKCDSMVWSWPGDGKSAHRSNIVVLNRARLDVLDTFLRYDGWDGEQPTLWARAKKGLGFEK